MVTLTQYGENKMKNINLLFALLGVVMLVLVGCSDNNGITNPLNNSAEILPQDNSVASMYMIDTPKGIAFPLWVDKETNVGTITIQNSKDYVYVTYQLDSGWSLKETNLQLAGNSNGIPISREGIPSPEQFMHSEMHESNVKGFTYMIPLGDYNFQINQEIAIAANAILVNEKNPVQKDQLVSAWGGDKRGPGPSWWRFMLYTLMENKNNGNPDKIDNIIVLDNDSNSTIQ